MRRMLLPALMIMLLLCSCGQSVPEQRLKELREHLDVSQEVHLSAEVTAGLEDEVFTCTLDCTATPERTTVEVRAPERIAGIRAEVDREGTRVAYEDLSLGVGGGAAPSPITALPLLLEALRGGSVLRSWTEWEQERTLFVREFYVTDDLTMTVWQDSRTLAPAYAELQSGGKMLLRCEITQFTYE